MQSCSGHLFEPLAGQRLGVASAAAVVLAVGVILACGPDFPTSFLESRSEVLNQAPEPTFADELRALIPPPTDRDKLKPVEGSQSHENQSEIEDENRTAEETGVSAPSDKAEGEGLTPDDLARVRALRKLADGEEAFATGEGLPEDVRHYTAGAVSFHHDQIDAARAHFEAVLALPAADRARRELWSHFMLGRMAVRRGDETDAAAHFEVVRALVRGGRPDVLGLAVATLGEEARVHLKPGGLAKSIQLYTVQASYGSQSGIASLLRVAGRVLADENWLDEAIQDNLARRLLFLYLNARVYTKSGYLEKSSAKPQIDQIVDALDRHGIIDRAGVGWLAASAYQAGRFDLAKRLAGTDGSPLSSWIRGKLAWRSGDTQAALAEYGDALAAYEREHRQDALSGELLAEAGLLRLGRAQFIEALDLFFRAASRVWSDSEWCSGEDCERSGVSDYWRDAAYLAERVLTTAELKQYVDQQVKPPTPKEVETALEEGKTLPGSVLRWLLARRLMRDGRFAEALTYFDDEHVRAVAEEYTGALSRTTRWWRSNVSRAEDWFAAATIARFDGMELLGYELSPDYAVFYGNYSLDDVGTDQTEAESERDDSSKESNPPLTTPTKAEKDRAAASGPKYNVRFQYRLTAVDHAMNAADNLPRSSQAFAAVLCKATEWIGDRQPDVAARLYSRYLKEGPYVRWARHFGRQCPQPNFDAARRRAWIVRVERIVGSGRADKGMYALIGLFTAVLPTVAWWYIRRRSRKPHADPANIVA